MEQLLLSVIICGAVVLTAIALYGLAIALYGLVLAVINNIKFVSPEKLEKTHREILGKDK